ncbi:UNVERIFIED_CONTAM: hypothetical protein Sindi_2309900 [Sesamum indicum]
MAGSPSVVVAEVTVEGEKGDTFDEETARLSCPLQLGVSRPQGEWEVRYGVVLPSAPPSGSTIDAHPLEQDFRQACRRLLVLVTVIGPVYHFHRLEDDSPMWQQLLRRQHTGLFVGNIPLRACPNSLIVNDKIAHAFNNSTHKTLLYIAPTLQNGKVIVRPSLESIRDGSQRWKVTAVRYFLGKKPYFHHLKELGQLIVLKKWESGMAIRKLKHTQTTEGLSTVASGIGKPLYLDAITRECTRLDFARVCVMLDVSAKLSRHIIIMTPNEDGRKTPCKVDVEYEWLPLKCTGCMSLGHSAKDCVLNKQTKPVKPLVSVYVLKVGPPRLPPQPARVIEDMQQTV